MRGGKLLAEAAPEVVMRRYGCETLEEAFLLLSIKQSKTDGGTEEPVVVESTGKSTRIYIYINFIRFFGGRVTAPGCAICPL